MTRLFIEIARYTELESKQLLLVAVRVWDISTIKKQVCLKTLSTVVAEPDFSTSATRQKNHLENCNSKIDA